MGGGKAKVIIIGGPTATGKTEVAISLAEALDGEIINADSMQFYKYMDIGTAKPSAEELKLAPHHLFSIVEPDEWFDAAKFMCLGRRLIEEISERCNVPLVVGGTGLYIRALIQGLFPGAEGNKDIRQSLYKEAESIGYGALYRRLKRLDPKAAEKIHPNDIYRIVRALEVIKLTGQQLSALHLSLIHI